MDLYYIDPNWCWENPKEAAAELERLHKWCDEIEAERDALAASCANIARQYGEIQEALVSERDRAEALVAHVERLHDDFDALVADSYGVAGLHLSGDVAPWGDLTEGGRFEEWLLSFSEKPTTSLARLIAEKQAEALEEWAEAYLGWAKIDARTIGAKEARKSALEFAENKRRQAGGGEHERF